MGIKSKVTCVIHTKNEEINIARAISSVKNFADEVLVVDMNSHDKTIKIAQSLGAKVMNAPDFGYVEPARKLALRAASFEWIFFLDADEVMTDSLATKLGEIVTNDSADAVIVSKRTYMFGCEIRDTGWGVTSERHMLFIKKQFCVLSDIVHVPISAKINARIADLSGQIDNAILHFNYLDFEHFVEKMNRYTSIEARNPQSESIGYLASSLCREVWLRLFKHKGWKDGYRGLTLVNLMVTYRVLVYSKARLLKELENRQQIVARYDDLAKEN